MQSILTVRTSTARRPRGKFIALALALRIVPAKFHHRDRVVFGASESERDIRFALPSRLARDAAR